MTVIATEQRRYRNRVPEEHRTSLDTRIMWLWNQRSGTVQAVWENSPDLLDRTAATMLLQAIFGQQLASIDLVFKRLEGGSLPDEVLADEDGLHI